MTLDEAIEYAKMFERNNFDNKQLVVWFEELKELREYKKKTKDGLKALERVMAWED